jgi:cathepsin B
LSFFFSSHLILYFFKIYIYLSQASKHGIVSGGNYGDDQTCAPYTLPPCEHHVPGSRPTCKEGEYKTPACPRTCKNSASFSGDKHYFQNGYSLPTVQSMMEDVYQHGSIQVAFTVYQDFLTYKSGVYVWDGTSPALGGHAVSIVGWGTTADGTEYWTVRNSWNTDWGNNGYFNIARGRDECGIEADANAGIPDYSRTPSA